MAKVTDPLPPAQRPAGWNDSMIYAATPHGTVVKKRTPETDWTSVEAALHSERAQAAVAAWKLLGTWKQWRWTLCAYRHGNPANAPTGYRGWSGVTLYTYCYVTQNTPDGHQPVSPCSRRITDPAASPWDYTP